MIINYESERYEFEFDDITVKQAMKIEKHVGVKLTDWGEQLAEGNNLLALQALGWVLFGAQGPIDDTDFKLVKLGNAFAEAIAAQAVAEAERATEADAVPTGAGPVSNGRKPDAAVPAASPPSSAPASP